MEREYVDISCRDDPESPNRNFVFALPNISMSFPDLSPPTHLADAADDRKKGEWAGNHNEVPITIWSPSIFTGTDSRPTPSQSPDTQAPVSISKREPWTPQ